MCWWSSATAPTTPSAGASCSPMRRWPISGTTMPQSAAAIEESFQRWDDIDVHFKGHVIRSGGHGFAGIARKRLLNILQERARALGVRLQLEREVERSFRLARRRSDRRGRRHQQRHPRTLRRGLPAERRVAQEQVHLARHRSALRGLHLRLRGDRRRGGSGRTPTASMPPPRPSSSSATRRPGAGSASIA